MANLDINGYNDTFRKFADFAQAEVAAGRHKAIADANVKDLKGRHILAVSTAENDAVHKWTRTNAQYIVNDRTRELFRKSVAGMFGGESKIPASVKEAMLTDDYDAGKPLTARRILAVKAAIDADGTARARSERIRLASFDYPENKAAMLAKGYSKAELPRLARAAHFYAELNHCAEFEALDEITTPGSKANRLMQYGGRFLESAANFREGLRLLDSFADWFAQTRATLEATGKNYQAGMSATILNGNRAYFADGVLRGMEKFVFEELASNPAHNLAETDPEKLFGMENNAATRFFGRGLGNSFTQTVANIPPARRGAFYAAVGTVIRLVDDPAVARKPVWQRREQGFQTVEDIDRGIVIARTMKNLDKLQALFDKGELTERNFVKTCFPEARQHTIAGVNGFIKQMRLDINGDDIRDIEPKYPLNLAGPIQTILEETGCSVPEAAAAAQGGKRPARPKYVASGTLPLSAFDGTVREARDQFEGDVNRPAGYTMNGQELLPPDGGFRFTFPDGSSYKTNAADGRANIPTVADKVEALCGAVHPEQASSVLTLLSQSGLGDLRGGLRGHGILSSEHSAVDYTITKDDRTGAVTVKYSSPKELPFRFEWTATADVHGNITTSPMKFEKPVGNLDNARAKKLLSDAAGRLGVKLDRRSLNAGAALLAQHGSGLFAGNLKYLASFIVRQPLTGDKAAASQARIATFAQDVRTWRSFPMGEGRLAELGGAIGRRHNEYIRECFADETKFHSENDRRTPIFETFFQDANRNNFVVNGKVFKREVGGNQTQAVIAAIRDALPNDAARKAVTVLMNQSAPGDILQLCNRIPVPGNNGEMENLHELPGANLFANRNMMSGVYPVMLLAPSMTFALDVAPDGRTATVTLTLDAQLEGGEGGNNRQVGDTKFGRAVIRERITLDLAPATPVVTKVAFGQKLL